MCGIIGYIGKKAAVPYLLDGMRRLEYRGYDSAGLVTVGDGTLRVKKAQGRISDLESRLQGHASFETLGIAHTRWATHGEPSETNAHPHLSCSGTIAVVHNGVIENFQHLKKNLVDEGHQFRSDTDSEVLAHLVGKYYKENLGEAVRLALRKIRGSYCIAAVAADQPNLIVAARRGSPLVLGIGDGEYFVSSDVVAIAPYTKRIVFPNDGELIRVSRQGFKTITLENIWVEKSAEEVEINTEEYEKGRFPHFMLKEMHEQPEVIRRSATGRILLDDGTVRFGGLNLTSAELRAFSRVSIIACGSSYNTGMVAKYLFEECAGLPTDVIVASEFRDKRINIGPETFVLAVSQSGETADIVAAIRELKHKGIRVYGISNVLGSTVSNETDGGIFLRAGPEIGVASTKAFLGQCTMLTMLALLMGRLRDMSIVDGRKVLRDLGRVPQIVSAILERRDEFLPAVKWLKDAKSALYLGRKMSLPIAMEGALKLKEIAYVHAEAYPAGEIKHGPIALVTTGFPTVILAPKDSVYEKTVSSFHELKARNARTIVIGTEGDETLAKDADFFFGIPQIHEMLQPLVLAVPMQILAYETAVSLGLDVDKPRNLAKSVIVE